MKINTPKCHDCYRTLTFNEEDAELNAEILAEDRAHLLEMVAEYDRLILLNERNRRRRGS